MEDDTRPIRPFIPILESISDVNLPGMLNLGSTQQRIREHPALAPLLQTYLADRALGGQGGSSANGTFDATLFIKWVIALSNLAPAIGDNLATGELSSAPLLDSWCAIVEDDVPLLVGRVSGHPHLREGARVRTSPLMNLQPKAGWARSCNRFYRLGLYDPSFLKTLQKDGRLSASAKLLRADRRS